MRVPSGVHTSRGPPATRAAAFLFLSSPRPRRWVPPEGRAAVPCPSLARGFPLTPTLPCPSLTVAVAEQRGTMRHGFGLGWVVCCSPFLPCQINDGPSDGKGGFGQAFVAESSPWERGRSLTRPVAGCKRRILLATRLEMAQLESLAAAVA